MDQFPKQDGETIYTARWSSPTQAPSNIFQDVDLHGLILKQSYTNSFSQFPNAALHGIILKQTYTDSFSSRSNTTQVPSHISPDRSLQHCKARTWPDGSIPQVQVEAWTRPDNHLISEAWTRLDNKLISEAWTHPDNNQPLQLLQSLEISQITVNFIFPNKLLWSLEYDQITVNVIIFNKLLWNLDFDRINSWLSSL